jgi:hypothetical protein
VVEVEGDLSVPQQLLDVTIERRGRGQFVRRLPDGLEGLRPDDRMTFQSQREGLDRWARNELVGTNVG